MKTPNGIGNWLVQHECGEWCNAEVRLDFEGKFEAIIPSCSGRWHSIEALSMNGWKNWKWPKKQISHGCYGENIHGGMTAELGPQPD